LSEAASTLRLSRPRFATRSRIVDALKVSSGNLLEMYDFMVFGYYAAAIGRAFFPAHSAFASLMLSLMTFGAGYLMRPLGALVLGSYTDRHGRRKGLIVTLTLMSVGTLTLALTPGFSTIGYLAPGFVLAGRLVQGFSAGVELGSVSVYLSEIATPGRKGFYVSWQSASQQIAVIFAASLGVALNNTLGVATMSAWGWRIPLLIGCAIVPALFILRRSLPETQAFAERTETLNARQVLSTLAANWKVVLTGMMMVAMTTVSFYLITAYTPTFGREVLKLGANQVLIAALCVGGSNLVWLPISGALSDRIGRKPILIASAAAAILTAYPVMAWLTAHPSFAHLLMGELWLSFLYGSYNGAMVVYLTEIVPASVRASGFSLAYSLATCIGGFTPALCTWLIRATGDKAIPGAWLTAAAISGLIAALIAKPARLAVRTQTV
jgi:MFS family permease